MQLTDKEFLLFEGVIILSAILLQRASKEARIFPKDSPEIEEAKRNIFIDTGVNYARHGFPGYMVSEVHFPAAADRAIWDSLEQEGCVHLVDMRTEVGTKTFAFMTHKLMDQVCAGLADSGCIPEEQNLTPRHVKAIRARLEQDMPTLKAAITGPQTIQAIANDLAKECKDQTRAGYHSAGKPGQAGFRHG